MHVIPLIGYYQVQDGNGRTATVTKGKRCSCGGTAEKQCAHIKAVAQHILAGGPRALTRRPDADRTEGATPRRIPAASRALLGVNGTCPICGAAVKRPTGIPTGDNGVPCFWRCSDDPAHYFLWRGEKQGIDKFLTQDHPNKMGAFYGLPTDDLEAFREAAAQRLFVAGYSPFC